jgi:hypothetical protein
MPRSSQFIDAEGTAYWIAARVRRQVRLGVPQPEVARLVGLDVHQVRMHLARASPYERCPRCGGMVLLPCKACELLGAI